MNNERRINNPLLNVSVTGGTIEDFTQNAVLLPAVELPPISTTNETNSTSPNLLDSFQNHPPTDQPNFYNQGQSPDFVSAITEEQNQTHQPRLQSVFSSFSSYLKLGASSTEEDRINAPPLLETTNVTQPLENVNIQSVPLYMPNDYNANFSAPVNQQNLPPPPLQGTTNSYRRTTLKRPTYAPIPGLTTQHLVGLPPIPSSTLQELPKIPSVPTTQGFTTNYFEPELSGYATPPQSNIIKPPTVPTPPLIQPVSLRYPSNTATFWQPQTLTVSKEEQVGNPNILTPTLELETRSILNPPIMSYSGDSFSNVQDNPQSETLNEHTQIYRPVYQHWFYKNVGDTREIWTPFSMADSLKLENTFLSNDESTALVATDGGRYDVNVLRRERHSVYWESKPNEVRRCSWFRKGTLDGRYVPYDENVATKLEEEFKIAFETNAWNRKVELPNGETVVFHGPDVLVLFTQAQSPDAWGNAPPQPRPRVVKRGMDEFHIDEGEPAKVDHLLFMVHGIGSVCDLKFRSVEEVVDEFRSVSLQLLQSHYRSSCDKGIANRIEVLPISWHGKLHSDDTGVDKKLKGITLESIPKLRDFTNDTILDVLFYTSPIYCQTIISSVGNELNRIFDVFKQRNPNFDGGVSLGGHSLGSLILFDLLCHQHPEEEELEEQTDQTEVEDEEEQDTVTSLKPHPTQRKISRRISYMMGKMGTGQPQLNYPNLSFQPKHFFALGSPIGMFVTVRGLDTLGENFALPTCPAFYNIFHPYDPVAYRIEALINPELAQLKPVLIPHHKGRKRMHLELKETMARVGADLKQKLIDSMKSTWNSFYQFKLFKSQNPPNLEEEVDKVLEEQLSKEHNQSELVEESQEENEHTDLSLGMLNQGKRIDYVLQEAPLEFFNEYIFALTSHVCYWESEDTMLLILKEIYNSMEISTDNKIPQQTMTIERPPLSPTFSNNHHHNPPVLGVDPTAPMTSKADIGPPPTAGFVRKA